METRGGAWERENLTGFIEKDANQSHPQFFWEFFEQIRGGGSLIGRLPASRRNRARGGDYRPGPERTGFQRDVLVAHDSERERFMALVDEHGAALMALLRRLCGNPHDADDVFQETAVRVWRNISACPRLQNPRGWLCTIGYRAFLDSRNRRGRFKVLGDQADLCETSPPDLVVQAEAAHHVQAAVAELPATIREVVVLHYTGGLSLRETAAAMNLSEGTVKSRLNAALLKLRSVLT